MRMTESVGHLLRTKGRDVWRVTADTSVYAALQLMADKNVGVVHTFTIKKLKEQGWDLMLKEGTQEFTLRAPSQPGKYHVVCKVYCGAIHQDMVMTMIVTP